MEDLLSVAAEWESLGLHWDTLTESYTRARLATAVGDWQAADRQLGPALSNLPVSVTIKIWSRRVELFLREVSRAEKEGAGRDDTVFDVVDRLQRRRHWLSDTDHGG